MHLQLLEVILISIYLIKKTYTNLYIIYDKKKYMDRLIPLLHLEV